MARAGQSKEQRTTGKQGGRGSARATHSTGFGEEAPVGGAAPPFETPQRSLGRRPQRHVVAGGDVAGSGAAAAPDPPATPATLDSDVATLDSQSSPAVDTAAFPTDTSPEATPVTFPLRGSVIPVERVPVTTSVTESETDAKLHALVFGVDQSLTEDQSVFVWLLKTVET